MGTPLAKARTNEQTDSIERKPAQLCERARSERQKGKKRKDRGGKTKKQERSQTRHAAANESPPKRKAEHGGIIPRYKESGGRKIKEQL